MINKKIYNKWKDFINDDKYKIYFLTRKEEWINNLDILKKYVEKYNKRPIYSDKNINTKYIAKWLQHQLYNYINKIGIMKNNKICNEWKNFINDEKYSKYFK